MASDTKKNFRQDRNKPGLFALIGVSYMQSPFLFLFKYTLVFAKKQRIFSNHIKRRSMKTPGQKLFEARDALGLNQSEFGEILGITSVTLRSYERGDPRLNQHQRWTLEGVGINPAYILCDDPKIDMLMPKVTIVQARESVRQVLTEIRAKKEEVSA